MNIKLKYIFCTILLISALGNSSSFGRKVNLSLDGAAFRYDNDKVLWEFYYSFPDTMLTYKYSNSKYSGELLFNVQIKTVDSVEANETWIVTNQLLKPPTEFKSNLVGVKPFILKPNQYSIFISVKDLNDSLTQAQTSFRLVVNKVPQTKLTMSDIQLARVIESDNETTQKWLPMFHKNSLYVVPNPSMEFYDKEPQLKAYAEVYNARTLSPLGYNIYFNVLDGNMKEVFSSPGKSNSISDGMVEMIELPLDALPTGKYYLQIKIAYPPQKETDSVFSLKKFYYLNSNIPPEATSNFIENEAFELSEFSTMSPERVEIEYEMAKYIARADEIDQWESLTENEAKQRFLFKFWKERDPDPSTPINERLEEYHKAIDYANTFFSYGKMKDGWRTDRGRVLLKYGFPTQKDQVPARDNNKPYETWYYDNVQSGVVFNFVDMLGYNNYRLVHSTCLGETYNPDWFSQYVSGDSNNNNYGK